MEVLRFCSRVVRGGVGNGRIGQVQSETTLLLWGKVLPAEPLRFSLLCYGEGFLNASVTALLAKVSWQSGAKEYSETTQHKRVIGRGKPRSCLCVGNVCRELRRSRR